MPCKKWEHTHSEIDRLITVEKVTENLEIARRIIDKFKLPVIPHSLREYIRIYRNASERGELKKEEKTFTELSDHDLKVKIKELFKRKDVFHITEICEGLATESKKIKRLIKELISFGHTFKIDGDNIIFSNVIPKQEAFKLNVVAMSTGFHKFGVCGDNHLCSRYERLDILNALYDLYEAEGITTVYNTGNWIEGEARFNKQDINTHGMGNQVDYFVKNYPQRKGITTYFIAGDDHEGWYLQREGIDIGKFAEIQAREAGRTDLVYLGYMEADITIKSPNNKGKTTIRVVHPGGGSSYAVSYSIQKLIESYQGGEKPDILLAGHYHKADYMFCRGVHAIQTACTVDQSPFMRKKKLAAHLGGWIAEFSTDNNGAITRFKQEFIPFYDNAYYKKWEYQMK